MEANDVLDRLERLLAHEAHAENVDAQGKALDHLADAFVTAGPALIRLARAAVVYCGDMDVELDEIRASLKALGEAKL